MPKIIKLGFCLVFLSLSLPGYGKDIGLNAAMTKIATEMASLYPLIFAQRELSAEEVDNVVKHLKKMDQLFAQAEPYIRNRSDTYLVSYRFIRPYLGETVQAFEQSNIDYGRSRLYGISEICTSCHTQDKHLRTLFPGAKRSDFNNDYVYAEFNYLSRNYEVAEQYFDKYLSDKKHKTEFQLIKPLQRLITIYAQIHNQPGNGATRLEKYTRLPDHTPTTRDALNGWISGLKKLDKENRKRNPQPDFATLQHYVTQYLGNLSQPLSELYLNEEEQISRVWLRGQLYDYLNGNPKKDEIPKILFWLSICDRSVGYNFYFSVADMYLKECIYNHSKHPYAKKCYSEYKEFITSVYTGSGGTFLPGQVEDELFEMKRLIK